MPRSGLIRSEDDDDDASLCRYLSTTIRYRCKGSFNFVPFYPWVYDASNGAAMIRFSEFGL